MLIRVTSRNVFSVNIHSPGVTIAVGLGITIGDDRSGVGVGIRVRVNNGGRSPVEGLVMAVGIAIVVGLNVAIAYRVRAVVTVQVGRIGISLGFRISGPLLKAGPMVAVASVIAWIAITMSVEEEDRVGVRLSLLDWRSTSKGRITVC